MPVVQPHLYRVLLLDLDGVLRRWASSDEALEQSCGLPAGALHAAAFSPELLHPAITGRLSDAAWRDQVVESLRRNYPAAQALEAVTTWSSHPGEVDAEVLALVERCAETIKIVLVTNATSRLNRDLTTLGLGQHFHAIVNSSAIGVAKPEPGFFRTALEVSQTPAEKALFVDDTLANVVAAEQLGIRSHHFTDYCGLLAFLQDWRVISKAP